MAYKRFAEVYDQLMSHAPYDEWVRFTEEIIAKADVNVQHIVDLGCGTGQVTIPLAKKGYQMTGVDNSSDMLTLATQRALAGKIDVNWIAQDIRALAGFESIDLFISYCDVINYITDKSDVFSVFQHVFDSLKNDGLFIFDVHSLSYVNDSLVNQTFAHAEEDLAYIWDCEPGEEVGEMYHYLTFFSKKNQQYERFDETHHQHVYDPSIYEQLLKKAGFTKIQFFADFQSEKINLENKHERIFIVAQKESR